MKKKFSIVEHLEDGSTKVIKNFDSFVGCIANRDEFGFLKDGGVLVLELDTAEIIQSMEALNLHIIDVLNSNIENMNDCKNCRVSSICTSQSTKKI